MLYLRAKSRRASNLADCLNSTIWDVGVVRIEVAFDRLRAGVMDHLNMGLRATIRSLAAHTMQVICPCICSCPEVSSPVRRVVLA